MPKNALFFVLALICAFLISASFAQSGQSCQNPAGLQGTCISLTSCPALVTLIQQKPLPRRDADFLRMSQCGREGQKPKVCCASNIATRFENDGAPPPPNPNIPMQNVCGEYLEEKITGGEATDLNEFPWMALLEYTKPTGKGFHCGGVLVSPRYVLTAAHCIKGQGITPSIRLTSVRLGEWNTKTDPDCLEGECSGPPQDIAIENTIVHDGYVPSSRDQLHDIALIRLAQPVTYTDWIHPICLPFINEELAKKSLVGRSLTAAGWGKTEVASDSDVKLRVDLPVVSSSECATTYRRSGVTLSSSQLCAGGREGKDSCRGDSGGPLMVLENNNWYVSGIVSFGPTPCGMKKWPGIYTDVLKYSSWISRNILE